MNRQPRSTSPSLLLVALLLGACASEDNGSQSEAAASDVPAGLERVETERVSLAVPEEFHEIDAPADSIWRYIYQNEEETAQVAISVPLEGYAARMATNVYIDVIGGAVDGLRPVPPEERPEWEQDIGEEDPELFHRSRFTYDGYETVLWSLAGPEREAVLVQYVSTSIDEDIAQAIEQSIYLDEADAT
ncbi:hypothetical protein [Bogoriella caseilytica]|uniref:Lipoprotein LpqN n=1 Tax=Bogoriella caseilytica TaxID=56055 RepID=A0A3N2BBQ9_9MICO|nr:hypothetical protein [Bogoriella caseilytica]ROR72675.1 hypothetical protein EDD31_1033 [Bogoriella caseilytica]